jgi:hypothetical protein
MSKSIDREKDEYHADKPVKKKGAEGILST